MFIIKVNESKHFKFLLNSITTINIHIHMYIVVHIHVFVLSCTFLSSSTALQAPLSIEFARQEYWSGLPSPIPENLPNPGIEPPSPALAGGFFITEPPRSSFHCSGGFTCINFFNPHNSPARLVSWLFLVVRRAWRCSRTCLQLAGGKRQSWGLSLASQTPELFS